MTGISAPRLLPSALRRSLAPPSEPRGSSALRLLRFERRWLLRIFETVIPGGVDTRLPVGAKDVPLGRFIDDLLQHAPLRFVLGVRGGVWLLMLAPLFLLGRCQSFLGLGLAERQALFERMLHSDLYVLREAPLLLKLSACLGFCGLATVQRSLGIHPTDPIPPSWAVKGAKGGP